MKYRDILGVADDADSDAIKRAYRRLAMQYHPDRNPDNPKAEEKFKEIKEAYEGLKEGHETKETRDAANNPGRRQPTEDDLESFVRHFRSSFGGFGPTPGFRSTLSELTVPVEKMFTGGIVVVPTMQRMNRGNGAVVFHTVPQKVNIPPNCKVGQKIKFKINGKEKSAVLFPESSGEYTVDGLDVGVSQQVDVLDLVVGTEIFVSHPNGKTLKVKINPVSGQSSLIRLKGKGLEDTFGMYGDYFVQLVPTVPVLDEKQKEILRKAMKKIRK